MVKIEYQWFTYGIFMLLLLPIVHQSLPVSLIFLLQWSYCCCRKQWLPINCQYSITNHSIGNFLPIGSQCFTNHQFTSSIGKFTNTCQWIPIGNDIWAITVSMWKCEINFYWNDLLTQSYAISFSIWKKATWFIA